MKRRLKTEGVVSLAALLSVPPRLSIIHAIAPPRGVRRSDHLGWMLDDIANAVGQVLFEVEPHVIALHEGGVLAWETDDSPEGDGGLWHIAPRVNARQIDETNEDGTIRRRLYFCATVDGGALRFRCAVE